MGMGERKRRAEQFKQKMKKKRDDDINEDNLFSKMTVESVLMYECFREPEDAPMKVGNTVKLIDMRDSILVFIGVRPVGQVITSQVDTLRNTLLLSRRRGRSVRGRIVEISGITATFVVQLVK